MNKKTSPPFLLLLAVLTAAGLAACTGKKSLRPTTETLPCLSVDSLTKEGKKAMESKSYAVAEAIYRHAAQQAQAQGCAPFKWAIARTNLSRAIRMGDDSLGVQRAIDTLLLDLDLAVARFPEVAGVFHFHLAQAYRVKDDFWGALPHYEAARQSNDAGKVVTQQSGQFLYYPLGNIYTRLGEYEKAIHLLSLAIDSSAAQHDTIGLRKIYADRGIAYLSMEQPTVACRDYRTGLFYSEAKKQPNNEAWKKNRSYLLSNLAEAMWQMEQPDSAGLLAKEALTFFPDNADAQMLAGEYLLQQGFVAAADSLMALAEELSRDGSTLNRSLAKIILQRTGLSKQTPMAALKRCHEALHYVLPSFDVDDPMASPNPADFYPENTILEALGLKSAIAQRLYQTTEDRRWLDLADTTVALALAMHDTLLRTYGFEESKLHAFQNARELHERQMKILFERFVGQQELAAGTRLVAFSEKSRATLLRQKRAEAAAFMEKAIPSALKKRELAIRQKIIALKNLLAEQEADGLETSETLRAIAAKEETLQAIEREKEKTPATYAGATRKDTVFALEQIRKLLPDEQACLIEYFYNPETSALYLLGIFQHDIRCATTTLSSNKIESFLAAIRNPDLSLQSEGDTLYRNNFVLQSRMLYDSLLAPILGRTPPSHLTLAPDGILGSIPFDLLMANDPKAGESTFFTFPYLLKQTAVHFIPSATVLLQSSGQATRQAADGYFGAAPSYCGFFPPTRYGAGCVKHIAAAYAGRYLLGFSCNKARFVQEAETCQIIHFYGHGKANGSNPQQSYLAFARPEYERDCGGDPGLGAKASALPAKEVNRVLFAHEIRAMHLRAELAVLSACETGIGKDAGPEGIFSLARAFMDAGCSATAMTLWAVDDNSTALLTRSFLDYVREGMPKDEALRKAKLDFLQSSESAAPFLWAGMVLAGDAGPLHYADGGCNIAIGNETIGCWFLAVLAGLMFFCLGVIYAIFRWSRS